MIRHCLKALLVLLIGTSVAQASDLCTPKQPEAMRYMTVRNLTADGARKLEESLNVKPDDFDTRAKLIAYYYYFMAQHADRGSDLGEKHQRHVLWLIEHCPDSALAGSHEARIDPVSGGSTDGYQRAKQLWLQQVEKFPTNVKVLINAAEYMSFWDVKIGRELLEKALLLDPRDAEASTLLARSFMLQRMRTESVEEQKALAQKALILRERALESQQGLFRFYALEEVAEAALEAGEIIKAQQYAGELLQSASEKRSDWNYGNAIHNGNILLGRIALQNGDIPGAKRHLVAAGETPGSPQLNSFGPNMSLAKELFEKGEAETVLTYLQSCTKFWEMGKDRLETWITAVKAGTKPDFSSNLND